MNRPTVDKLMAKIDSHIMLGIFDELNEGVVPSSGLARTLVRDINHMIDSGTLCIDRHTYRKLYLPTLAKAVQKEMARRYAVALHDHTIQSKQTLSASCEQIAFNLVEQVKQINEEAL